MAEPRADLLCAPSATLISPLTKRSARPGNAGLGYNCAFPVLANVEPKALPRRHKLGSLQKGKDWTLKFASHSVLATFSNNPNRNPRHARNKKHETPRKKCEISVIDGMSHFHRAECQSKNKIEPVPHSSACGTLPRPVTSYQAKSGHCGALCSRFLAFNYALTERQAAQTRAVMLK